MYLLNQYILIDTIVVLIYHVMITNLMFLQLFI